MNDYHNNENPNRKEDGIPADNDVHQKSDEKEITLV